MSLVAPAPRRAVDGAGPLREAIARGLERLAARQDPTDGAWRGDYSGPLFLLPMYVAACAIAERPIPSERRAGIIAHLRRVQNADGSVGLHPESAGYLFSSTLAYVALRLLGVGPDDPAAARLRGWIHAHGSPLGAASWGKLVLALLNLYPYHGLLPVLPELWLLPRAAPVHPGRLWCHCRQVYLPLAYLYGTRAAMPETELVRQLRAELYARPYARLPFHRHRTTVADCDRQVPVSSALALADRVLAAYERLAPAALRRRALVAVYDHIAYEDRATNHIRIGPVNAVLNTLVHVFRRDADQTRRSFAALDRYLWAADDEVRMGGYNSTALWDTSFAVQAMLATPQGMDHRATLERAHDYIRDNQIVDELPQAARYLRHPCRGGWPFSDRPHGWPISDCTAEALKCALLLAPLARQPIGDELLRAAVDRILSWHNRDGGWATYERRRGGRWLERLNPSQVFAGIMVDYSCVECTSSCMQALDRATAGLIDDRRGRGVLRRAIRRGERFIRSRQRADGGFEGSWGVCFTYGTWFAVGGLRAAGADERDPALRRACEFLTRHQGRDGSWSEHGDSCLQRRYVPREAGHPVNTAWALLTLVSAGAARTPAAVAAARWLVEQQTPDGEWPEAGMVGVFNRTTLLNYDNYRRYFPLWALGCFSAAGGRLVTPARAAHVHQGLELHCAAAAAAARTTGGGPHVDS